MPGLTADERDALASATREIRARLHLTQEIVAERGDLGAKTVGQVERSEIQPSFATVTAIARGLGVPLSELVRVYEERLSGS